MGSVNGGWFLMVGMFVMWCCICGVGFAGSYSPVVTVCGVNWSSVCVVIDGVLIDCGEVEAPVV